MFWAQLHRLSTFFRPIKKLIMITIWSYWSPNNSKYHYQYNDHECFVINCITKIMITNVSGQIRYQYNDHERFLGPLITGNVHRAHDHIHDLQRLQYSVHTVCCRRSLPRVECNTTRSTTRSAFQGNKVGEKDQIGILSCCKSFLQWGKDQTKSYIYNIIYYNIL